MNRKRKNERGVTLIVVAFTLVAILAMAALSIDVAELYVARGEAQRAADAAALAGAKMFVTSGFTSVQGSGLAVADPTNVCTGGPSSTAAANVQAAAAATNNLIAGQPAVVTSITCDTTTNPENPQITVSVTRAAVPTFFARVWGKTATTVNATAVAEAYNPSGDPTTPIATTVKPWLIPNCNPAGGACPGAYFVDPATGAIKNNGAFIGTTVDLSIITTGAGKGTAGTLSSYALNIPVTTPLCPSSGSLPSCSQVGSNNYLDNIACSSQAPLKCGQQIGSGQTVKVQTFGVTTARTISGGECLIHASGAQLNQGQDSLVAPGPPAIIQGGENNPNPNLEGMPNISRSDSIVSVPLYDGSMLCTGGRGGGCTVSRSVIGFLQLAITQLDPTATGTPQVEAVILNASGCNTSMSGQPVTGSGTSPVPVRLIHN